MLQKRSGLELVYNFYPKLYMRSEFREQVDAESPLF